MKKLSVSWGLKNSKGHLSGPFSTSQIINMINEGQLSGTEQISRLPGSQWTELSSEPEFYDFLLKSLESENKSPLEEQDLNKTIVEIPKPNFTKDTALQRNKPPQLTELNNSNEMTQIIPPPKTSSNNSDDSSEVIELQNIQGLKKSKVLQDNKLMIAASFVIFLAVAFLIYPTKSKITKIHLLEPVPQKQAELNTDEIKSNFAQAVNYFSQYTFETNLKAQNLLVSNLDSSPDNIESRVLLCFVYKDLWPFTYQDAQDIQTLNNVVMAVRRANGPNSMQSHLCEVARLMTLGRINEAKGEIQTLADMRIDDGQIKIGIADFKPLIHLLQAELLEIEKNFLYAKTYYENFNATLPSWIKPLIALARIYYEENQDPKGYEYLKKVLKINPNHKSALILIGLYEYKYNRTENSFKFLDSALSQNSLIDNRLEAHGLLILSKIYLSRGDKAKALEYAKRGYLLDFGNQELKSILSRLDQKIQESSPDQKAQYFEFLGDEFYRKEDFLSAQAEYKTAFDLYPKRGMTAMKAAKSLWKIHQTGDSIHWLEKAIQAEPQLVSAYILLSDYYAQKYDFVNSTQILKKAVSIAPNNYEVYKGLALLEFRKLNWPLSIKYAQLSKSAFDQDIDTYLIISEANLNLSMGIMGITKEETARKEAGFKEAKIFSQRALELDPSNPEVQVLRVKIAAQEYGTDYGIEELNKLINNYPFTIYYRTELAKLLMSQERYTDALSLYRQIVSLDDKSTEGFLGLGKVLRILGNNNESIKALYKAAIIDSSDAEPLFQIGVLYFESGQLEKALNQFTKVREQNPYFPRVNYYFGKTAFELGKLDEAEASAKLEKKNNPKLADPYLLLGEIYEARKNYSECAAIYSKAISLDVTPTAVYIKAARCYRLSGTYDIAENMLKIAFSKESGYADLYKEQGALYHAKGETAMALDAFNKYLELSPNASDRAQIENMISILNR